VASIWFWLLAGMITAYVVLDGFDLGVGALHRPLARDGEQRDQAIGLIGPVWDGNEVWLVAAGGTLFLGFPRAYAGSFSGFYFGLIIVLWLLVGRGLGIELRHRFDNPLWTTACDTVFWLCSAALAFMLGVALGNVVRGVPLGPSGYFYAPLFDLLNWYALLTGLFALVVLVAHGATFLAARARGELAERARSLARRMWWAELAFVAGMVYPTYAVRHRMLTSFGDHPARLVLPAIALVSLGALFVCQRRGRWGYAFLASSALIVGLLTTLAAGLYPSILPARQGRPFGLTIHNAAASDHALTVGLRWWSLGIVLALSYFFVAYRFLFRRADSCSRESSEDHARANMGA
jgi:cytochrome bd ubiquinol oxidase subunit II